MKSPLEAPEKQIAEETSAKPRKAERLRRSSTPQRCRKASAQRWSWRKLHAIRSMIAAVSRAIFSSADTISLGSILIRSKAPKIAPPERSF